MASPVCVLDKQGMSAWRYRPNAEGSPPRLGHINANEPGNSKFDSFGLLIDAGNCDRMCEPLS